MNLIRTHVLKQHKANVASAQFRRACGASSDPVGRMETNCVQIFFFFPRRKHGI